MADVAMSDATAPSLPSLDPLALKARFKQICEQTGNAHQNWQIRVHRSLSWLKRATDFTDEQPEARYLFLWIALNSLYSRWNGEKNVPDFDARARRDFLRRLCGLDSAAVGAMLRENHGLVRKVLGNPFLSNVFWREPQNPAAKGWATEDEKHLSRNLHTGQWCRALEQVVDRLYVLRGQIVHGASTGGSRLNRTTLKYCLETLAALVPRIVQIVIERGCNDDWPELCYPPIS